MSGQRNKEGGIIAFIRLSYDEDIVNHHLLMVWTMS